MGTYYLPQITCAASLYPHLPDKVRKIEESHASLSDAIPGDAAILVSGGAARERSLLSPDSIDYVFTDPAHVDKWLYRLPDEAEAKSLKKARETGLGRRIRQFASYLNGRGEHPEERIPDVETLCMWLDHCANFGMPEERVALFEKGSLAAQLTRLPEELRWDAEEYYAQCRCRAGRAAAASIDQEDEQSESEDE